MSEIDIELTAACDRLRIMIRNEQQRITLRHGVRWQLLHQHRGGLKMKLIIYKLMYRLTNDRRWVIRFVDEMDRQILEDIRRFRNETNR